MYTYRYIIDKRSYILSFHLYIGCSSNVVMYTYRYIMGKRRYILRTRHYIGYNWYYVMYFFVYIQITNHVFIP